MLRRLAVLVLLSMAGSAVGVLAAGYGMHFYPDWFGWLGGYRYYVDQVIVLAPGSDAQQMVAAMKGQHPGADCGPSPPSHRCLREGQLPRGVAGNQGQPGGRRAQRRQGEAVYGHHNPGPGGRPDGVWPARRPWDRARALRAS